MNRNDDDFDARLRGTWLNAVDAVPPALARRLRPGQRTARAQRTPARWPLGAAFAAAAMIALAIGLRSHPAALPLAAPAIVVSSADDVTAPLDRNPDFYAWLASPDAEQLAME